MPQRADDAAFESQYQRVLEAAGCRTQEELADFLAIRQSSISDAKRRRSIPAEWRMKLLEKKQINPAWILSGKGLRYLVPAGVRQAAGEAVPEVRALEDCSARELADELVRRAMRKRP